MRRRARILVPLLACLCGARVQAQDAPGLSLPVREVSLDNGMRVLVLPKSGSPTVAFVVQYAVGGVNERLGTTGIAHLLEHLLFKGTTTVGTRNLAAERALFGVMDAVHDTLLQARGTLRPDSLLVRRLEARIRALEDSARVYVESNEFDRILSREGARGLNATTSNEATTYFVELPANRIQLWFTLEADRMRNPVFREFYTERDVVMEERRMRTDDSPSGLLAEAQLAAAYQVHPFGVPVVGWMTDLQALSRAQVEDYYRRYYGPSNVVVAIVGDVDPEQVTRWVREYFGGIAPGERPPPVLAREPVQRGERRVEVEYDAEPQLRIGWHVPELFHEDTPAISMLSAILSGGRTSRLYRRLVVQERVATLALASSGPGELYPQLFQITAVPRAPHTSAEVEALVYDEIERLKQTPPTDVELERVKSQLQAGEVRRLDSNLGLAFQLADSESSLGDWRATFRLGERMRAVTPADVQRVAQRYFTKSNRTVATLVRPVAAPR